MKRWRVPASVLCALIFAAAPLRADELTEDQKAIKRAKRIDVNDLRNLLDKDKNSPPIDIPEAEVEVTTEKLITELKQISADMLSPMERLDTMRGGYATLADLAIVDVERNDLRRDLLERQSRFNEKLQVFNSIKKMRQTSDLQQLLAGAMKGDASKRISDAISLAYFGEEMRNFRLKLRSILQEDEEAYLGRKLAIEEQRARERAMRRAVIAGGGVFLLFCGVAIFVWKRRRVIGAFGPLGPGSIIGGNYRFEREIGRGGMGLVFEATDIALQRKVAIKQLRTELKQSPRDLEMFLAEARLVAQLKHPYIVEIYAIVNDGSDLHLVFELVVGQPLHEMLQRVGRISLGHAYTLMQQVGSALDFAHANKVIHRDLKPANIMMTPAGSAKVMDFGLAHQASMTVARLTKAESWGTPPYMAPEQELGNVSRESDLYAVGVMLYEALTGRLPFPGPNFLAQKREMHFPLPTQIAPGLPKGVDDVILRALQVDPKLRFHSAAEFVQALAPLAAPDGMARRAPSAP